MAQKPTHTENAIALGDANKVFVVTRLKIFFLSVLYNITEAGELRVTQRQSHKKCMS